MNPEIFGGIAAVLAVLLGGMIVLVPVLGLTARFALRPTLEAWIRLKSDPTLSDQVQLLNRQVALLESELQHVQQTTQSLLEAQEFQRRLQNPGNVST